MDSDHAKSAVRISMGPSTTMEEVRHCVTQLKETLEALALMWEFEVRLGLYMTGFYFIDLLLALSPAVVAICLALFTRNVIPSLAAGVFAGALVAHQVYALDALASFLDYMMEAVLPGVASLTLTERQRECAWGYLGAAAPQSPVELDYSHLVITGFSILVAATVSVMTKTGATRTVVGYIERLAKGPRGQWYPRGFRAVWFFLTIMQIASWLEIPWALSWIVLESAAQNSPISLIPQLHPLHRLP